MIRLQYGYTYLTLLFALAFMGAGLAAASSLWHTAQMREKERELLYVGDQYRKAIEAYYMQAKQYPRELTQLLRDQRVPGVRRYLRKLYRDPMTGKNDWGLVKAPDGGIAGVYSLSEEVPFKQANFTKDYAAFTGKAKYSDWKFAHLPPGAPGSAPQGAPGTASAPGTQPASAAPGMPGATAGPGMPGTASSSQPGSGAASPGGPSSQGTLGAPFGTPSGGLTPPGSGGAATGAPQQPGAPRP
jgi:type II secretory pathway pseudopilin PulG